MASTKRTARRKALTLKELRAHRGVRQIDAAGALDTSQSLLSRLERRANLRVDTLRDYVAALGGKLVLVARFQREEIEIRTGEE